MSNSPRYTAEIKSTAGDLVTVVLRGFGPLAGQTVTVRYTDITPYYSLVDGEVTLFHSARPTQTYPSTEWSNLHCYHCGQALQTPLDQITEDNEQTANSQHAACFN